MWLQDHGRPGSAPFPPLRSAARRRSTLLLSLGLIAWAATACGTDPRPGPSHPRHLLLITVDTLRADHLGCYGYPRGTSPAIDRLAAESVVFERAYASSSWTLPSLASLMTSFYTSTHGCWDDESALADEFDTLAEHLSRQGFRTGAIVNHLYLDARFGLHQGFDDYDEELIQEGMRDSHEAVTSPRVTEKAAAWLAARAGEPEDSRWFLWAHYFDPHFRYVHHEGVTPRFARESAWGSSYADMDLYDGEIAFTDENIGRLLETLKQLGMADETVVVLVADHGEEFGEHGGWGHRNTLYRETVQVPLLLRGPGLRPNRMEHPVSTLDVMPTVLEMMGAPLDTVSEGRSLLPLILSGERDPARPFLAELRHRRLHLSSIQRGRWRLIHERHADRLELYDIEADPSEQHDLAEVEPAVVAELKADLERELARARELSEERGEPRRVDLTPSDLQRIRDLGYTDDGD